MIVQAKNLAVLTFIDPDWVLYACATSATLNLATEFIETSVTGSGSFATFLPTKHSFTGTLNGVCSLEETPLLSLADLRTKQINKTALLMRFQRTDEAGNLYTDEATFYIANSSDSGSFDDVDRFTIELQGTGALNATSTPFVRFRSREQNTGNINTWLFYLEGTPVEDDQITVHLSVSGVPHDFTYTVLSGDTIEDVTDALFALIDADPAFTPTNMTTGILVYQFGIAGYSPSVEITLI